MSCLIKNIDEFCKNFSSVSFNSGSFNNTSVEVQVLGAKDEPDLDGDIFSLKNNFGDVLPFLEEEFKVVKAKSSRSESGVITSYSLQDHASITAASFMVGLSGRIGGDVMIGDEYYSVRGLPDPEGIGIPQDLLFSRNRLLSYYNRVKDGSHYINSAGNLASNPNHWKNKENGDMGGMIGNVPDPTLEHGQILYPAGKLFSVSPLPLPVQELQGVSGLYSDTGSFFDVMNSILSRFSKIFVANPFLGGFYIHSLGSDFGKKEVLQSAGVVVPDSAISSSLEKDYLSGYSSGAFIRKWSNGTNPNSEPDSKSGGNAHTMEINFRESDADETDAIFELQDVITGWSQKINSDKYSHKLPSSTPGQAQAFAVEKMHEAGLAQEYELAFGAYNGDSGTSRVVNEDRKLALLNKFSEFKDEEGEINVDRYEVFENAGDLVEWVNSWGKDPEEINSPGPWKNCYLNTESPEGERVNPAVMEFFLGNEERWQIKSKWGYKAITQNGDVYGYTVNDFMDTFSFETLGTSYDPCGSKSWYTDEGSEVSFVSVTTKIKDSPFSFFSNFEATGYDDMTVKDFFFGSGSAIGGKASLPILPSQFPDESEGLQGIILTDKGVKPVYYQEEASEIISAYTEEKSFYSNYSFPHLPGEDYSDDILVIPLYGGTPIVFNILNDLREFGQTIFENAGRDTISHGGSEINDTLRYYGSGTRTSPTYRQIENVGQGWQGQPLWVPGQLPVSGSESNPVHVQKVLRHNSLEGNAGCIHPNRNLKTFSAELTTEFKDGSNHYNRYYGTDGKINLNAYNLFLNQGPACVESLDRIEFTLVGELIDFSHNDWINTKKYLESMSINVSGGTLTASYAFSQKVMLPDYLGISAARASRMNLIM
jgi:hypothetical protein